MDAFQPVLVFNGLEVNTLSATTLIEEYHRELSEVEALITRVEDDKRDDKMAPHSSREAMRLQLQRQIDDLRAQELVEVEQLEATSQARRASLYEKRKSILAKMNGVKHSIAFIQNVPTEILGYIFREAVALHVAPWLLTAVSKSWRRTAMINPWLWSNIFVGEVDNYSVPIRDVSRWVVDGTARTCWGNAVTCRSPDELAYYADKSGAVPLDVWVYFFGKGDHWPVLHHLLGRHLSSRIRSLTIFLSMAAEATRDGRELLLGPFTLLDQLSCGSTRESLVQLIISQAHQLKDLEAGSLSDDLPKYLFWKTLRTLVLGWWAGAGELNQVISDLQRIEVIKGSPRNWPNIDTPIVTLQYIKSIELACHLRHIARLRLPRLEKLVWYDYLPYGSSDYSTDPAWCLSLPNLVEIEASAVGEAFVVVLRELPNVHTAILASIHSEDSKDPWALGLIQSLAGAEDMLCPKLRHLTLKHLEANKDVTEPLVRRLIISRRALGIPFKHFEVVWVTRSGEREEIVQYALPE